MNISVHLISVAKPTQLLPNRSGPAGPTAVPQILPYHKQLPPPTRPSIIHQSFRLHVYLWGLWPSLECSVQISLLQRSSRSDGRWAYVRWQLIHFLNRKCYCAWSQQNHTGWNPQHYNSGSVGCRAVWIQGAKQAAFHWNRQWRIGQPQNQTQHSMCKFTLQPLLCMFT